MRNLQRRVEALERAVTASDDPLIVIVRSFAEAPLTGYRLLPNGGNGATDTVSRHSCEADDTFEARAVARYLERHPASALVTLGEIRHQ
jgi:hypothetical protein